MIFFKSVVKKTVDWIELKRRALSIRSDVLRMMGVARTGHLASSLSVVDILVWLYGGVLSVCPDDPQWEERDRFVLGMGTASPALYAVLAERGFFQRTELWGYRKLGSTLQAFADSRRTPGIDASCAAVGTGIGIALGMSVALRTPPSRRVFCLIDDSELDEGATWEALGLCSREKLGNLTLIINRNQADEENAERFGCYRLEDKLTTFGWIVSTADGHDMPSLDSALANFSENSPRVLLAATIHGKGIASLEKGILNGKVTLDRQVTDELLKELETQNGLCL